MQAAYSRVAPGADTHGGCIVSSHARARFRVNQDSRWRAAQWSRLLVSLVIVALFAFAAWKLGFFRRNAPQRVVAEAERIAGHRWLATMFVLVYATLSAFALPVTVLA